jgi:outer membrane protein TolC
MISGSAFGKGSRCACLTLLAAALIGLCAASPLPAQSAQTAQPPANVGVTPLPQTPPPTTLQAPLPAPSLPIPPADHPALVSPTLSALLTSRPLTIQEIVAVSLATNRQLALANEQLLTAEGRTSELRAALNPTVTGNYQFIHYGNGESVSFQGLSFVVLIQDQHTLSANATLPIDVSGLLRAATDQAHFQEIAARLDVNRTRNQIVLDVKGAFYNVLRAQALVTVANDNLTDSLARLDDARKKFNAGTVARFDVIRAQTDVANAQQQLVQARSNVSLALASLNNTVGIDVNTPLRLTSAGAVENPPDVAPPALPPVTPPRLPAPENGGAGAQIPTVPSAPATPPTFRPQGAGTAMETGQLDALDLGPVYSAAVGEALKTRPELLESEANLAAAKKGILLAQRSVLPTAGLSTGLAYMPSTSTFAPQQTVWETVLQVSIPIWDGGVVRGRMREARATVAQAETNRRQAVDLVTLEVRQAYLNLLQARDRVAVANQALAEAQETFRLARVRYNAGVSSAAGISPLLEVSDAQAALTQAESNQVNALYDYNDARAQLDKAIGRYSYQPNAPGYASPISIANPPKSARRH